MNSLYAGRKQYKNHGIMVMIAMSIVLVCVMVRQGVTGGRKPTPGTIRSSVSFMEQRIKMVEIQIEARGVTDEQILEAMLKVPRHLFVPVPVRFVPMIHGNETK
jgi:hypothetical protein